MYAHMHVRIARGSYNIIPTCLGGHTFSSDVLTISAGYNTHSHQMSSPSVPVRTHISSDVLAISAGCSVHELGVERGVRY